MSFQVNEFNDEPVDRVPLDVDTTQFPDSALKRLGWKKDTLTGNAGAHPGGFPDIGGQSGSSGTNGSWAAAASGGG